MNSLMTYSKAGLTLTERFEGCRLTAYPDTGGVWTIGYGHTYGVHEGMTCTQDQAQAWLIEDTRSATDAVNHLVSIPLKQSEFDALVDFVFNLGVGAFARSTMLKDINAGNLAAAALQFPLWDRDAGRVLAGLLHRRLAEDAEFNAGTPA
ncbi:MAG: lysozyme [Betaproteobacteria bacterium]|nr:lysozyme [Betaproteobacteria bacterium]